METIPSVKQLATNLLKQENHPALELSGKGMRTVFEVNANQKDTISSGISAAPFLKPAISDKQAPELSLFTAVAKGIAELGKTAQANRQQDQNQGVSLLKGAGDFGKETEGLYKFLLSLQSDGVGGANRSEQLRHVVKQYLLSEAGSLLAAENSSALMPLAVNIADKIEQQPVVTSGAVLSSAIDPLAEASGNLGEYGSKILGAAGAAYSIYEIFKGSLNPIDGAVSGMASGAYIGTQIAPGIGTTIGAVIGGIGGIFSGLFKSGKPKEQKERDAIRKQLQAAGILDQNWNIELANGGKFDMGKDGGAKLQNVDGSMRHYKEFDLSNPLTQPVMQMVAPLAQMITAGHPRLTEEFSAYLTNAANSNAGSIEQAVQNLQVIYAKFGVPFEQVLKKLAA